jgi:ankyrin repeat protein
MEAHVIRVLAAAIVVPVVISSLATQRARPDQGPPQAPQAEVIPPLVEAIWTQDVDAVKRLLDEGADPTATTVSGGGRPAWQWAIVAREDRAVELLLAKVKKVDRANALLMAANRNDVQLTRALLDREMPIDGRATDGATAVMIAAASGYVETLGLLIERGADVKLQDQHGDTALSAAVRAGSLESVKVLLSLGAEVDHKDNAGRTPLMWAARSGRLDVLNALIAAGAAINVIDGGGHTALSAAAQKRQATVVEALRAKGGRGDTSELSKPLPSPRVAVERSLPLLQRGTAMWDERQRCAPCHHHPMMLRAIGVARRQGFAIDTQLLETQLERLRRGPSESRLKEALMSDASVLSASLRTGGDPSFGSPWFLSSFADANLLEANAESEALLIARMQLRDGSWRCAPPRVPIMSSDFTATATAIRSLRTFRSPVNAEELDRRVERAAAWLRTTMPVTTDDKAFRLFGLHWAESEATLIADAAALLRPEQNPDGGWAQLRGLNSDAYATGLVLVALHEVGLMRTDDPVYQRGVKYLLESQEPDGSWLVHKRAVPINAYFESGFPHGKFQFISYAGTGWTTMALAYAAPPTGRE